MLPPNWENTRKVNITNILELAYPGIYEIHCLKNNKVYVGESQNILSRLADHVSTLQQNRSHSLPLQKDWNQFSMNKFDFIVRFIGPNFQNKNKRLQIEAELIKFYEKKYGKTYNSTGPLEARGLNYRSIIEIDGTIYSSIEEAASTLNLGRTTILRNVRDPKKHNFRLIEQVPQGSSKISVNGVIYNTVSEIVKAGLVTTRHQATRRLASKSPKWKDWIYLDRAFNHTRTYIKQERIN
uniref:putative GIY YIG homing endonuclease n=1 Tax=Massjukichlorella minus TaxID=2650457 RepID=UPI002410FB84|nr:putative GIY YIG homing endonuclease [Massjukichlorella minus]WDY13010.1 putative GIY YIG homing endonuclease [Massjukichlorella minus]